MRLNRFLILISLLIFFGLTTLYALPSNYALIVSSASGDEEFKEKFWGWSNQMVQILRQDLKFPKGNVIFLFEDPAKDPADVTAKSTKNELVKAFEDLGSRIKEEDLLFILLIGHGSFDGKEYKFNLVGPDITGSELKSWLDRFNRQTVVLVCSTPCSGILTKTLSRKGRVVITATKNEFENNDTLFAQFFIEAFKNKSADTDKNGQVSVLEAFLYTSQKVEGWYQEKNRLATEHSLLEDNGDQTGSGRPAPSNGEGLLAAKLSLEWPSENIVQGEGSQAISPELQALRSSKQKIEAAVQELKYRKAALPEAEYNQQLESLLIQLAQTNQKIQSLKKMEAR